ncbi:unnamed protein product, partial [Rotaria magnacalcarata]
QQQHFIEPPKKTLSRKRLYARFESGSLNEELTDNDNSGNESEEYDCTIKKKGDELDRYRLFEFDKNKVPKQPLDFGRNHHELFHIFQSMLDQYFQFLQQQQM